MKTVIASLALVATLGIAVPAVAAPWTPINARQSTLQSRIDQGVSSGALTRPEARQLQTQFRQLARLETRYRASRGLSARERSDLNARFDALSARVRADKHDRQTRR